MGALFGWMAEGWLQVLAKDPSATDTSLIQQAGKLSNLTRLLCVSQFLCSIAVPILRLTRDS
jgi:hypothetical protein